jgi:hypothetical protein
MAERRPIYSAQVASQQIGYIEDDEAFDLFDRACAVYESNTGLLRDPKNNAVVGYLSLTDMFVGSSWMALELFSKTGPIAPRESLEDLEDEHSEPRVSEAGDGDADNGGAVRLIAQEQPDPAVKTLHSETASVGERAPSATDIMTFASSSQQDKRVGPVLLPPTDLGDSLPEESAEPQEASDAGNRFLPGKPGSDYPNHAVPALQPRDDSSVIKSEPADQSAFESGQSDGPSGAQSMPPAVEAFMRHLNEYLHPTNHQIATLPADDAVELKLSPSSEAQRDTDQVPVPGEPNLPEG